MGRPTWYDKALDKELTIFQKVESSPPFKFASLVLIFSYLLFVGLKANLLTYNLKNQKEVTYGMNVFDLVFDALFVVEYAVRVGALKRNMFAWSKGEGTFLNLMDTVCVVFIMLDLLASVTDLSSVGVPGGALRALRLSRGIRIFRFTSAGFVFKEFRFFTNMLLTTLRLMVAMWTIVLALTYITAVTIQVAYVSWLENKLLKGIPFEDLLMYEGEWSTLRTTMFTLIASACGARSWDVVIGSLAVFGLGDFYVALFLVYVLMCIFGVFNVAAAIFVHGTHAAALRDHCQVLQNNVADDYSAIFSAREMLLPYASSDGTITWEFFSSIMHDPRFTSVMEDNGLDKSQVEGMFRLMEWGTQRKVNLNSFLWAIANLERTQQGVDLLTLMAENQRVTGSIREYMGHVETDLETIKSALLLLSKAIRNADKYAGAQPNFYSGSSSASIDVGSAGRTFDEAMDGPPVKANRGTKKKVTFSIETDEQGDTAI